MKGVDQVAEQKAVGQSLYIFQHSQDLNDLFRHLAAIIEPRVSSFSLALGANKPVRGEVKYSGLVTCRDFAGKPHTCVIADAENPVDMVNQLEQFLKRL